jgi:hypothetical protein
LGGCLKKKKKEKEIKKKPEAKCRKGSKNHNWFNQNLILGLSLPSPVCFLTDTIPSMYNHGVALNAKHLASRKKNIYVLIV